MKAVKERNRQKITKRGIEIDRKIIHYFGYERRIVGSKYTFQIPLYFFEYNGQSATTAWTHLTTTRTGTRSCEHHNAATSKFRFLQRRRDARPFSRQLYPHPREARPRNEQWAVSCYALGTSSGNRCVPTSILMLFEPATAHKSVLHTLTFKIHKFVRWASYPMGYRHVCLFRRANSRHGTKRNVTCRRFSHW